MVKVYERVVGWARAHPDAAAVIGLSGAGAALRLWPLLAIRFSYEDAYFYIELARGLAGGRWELMGEFHTKYLPGFPGAIVAMHTLLFGLADWFKSAQAVSFVCSAAIPGMCYGLGLELTGRRSDALAGAVIAALNAQLVVMAGVPWSEAVFAFQVIAALALIRRAPMAAGVVAGWAAVTRHEGLFLAGVFGLAMLEGPGRGRRLRLGAGLGIMITIAGCWWIESYAKTGKWLWEIYVTEEAERRESLSRAGPGFILLAFPAAGHLAALLALPGLAALFRKRSAWPMLGFFLAFYALHAWWLFRDERYFVPLVPLVIVLAGAGAGAVGRRLGGRAAPGRAVVAGLAVGAGVTHFLGFAPGLVREETSRNRGYYEAVEYLRQAPGDFTIIAYDALMVGYHTGKPVIASGGISAEDWKDYMPEMFVNYNARYILWSDFYPADRAKAELGSPDPMWISGTVAAGGREREIVLDLRLVQEFRWAAREGVPGWLVPWRRERTSDSVAYLFSIRYDGPP